MGAKAMLAQGLALGLMPAFELGVRSPWLSSALGIGYVAALIEFVPSLCRPLVEKQNANRRYGTSGINFMQVMSSIWLSGAPFMRAMTPILLRRTADSQLCQWHLAGCV